LKVQEITNCKAMTVQVIKDRTWLISNILRQNFYKELVLIFSIYVSYPTGIE
jgi:hypothetical protein